MNIQTILDELYAAMTRRMATLPQRIRPFTQEIESLPRAISLTGPRGVGKTVFLLHHARDKNFLYVSADSPLIANTDLYELIKAVFQKGFEGLIIDEVHFAKNWSRSLKAAYDEYPKQNLWISDSSSLILRTGTADLSRRFLSIEMPLMSFREFLFLESGELYKKFHAFTDNARIPVEPEPKILRAWQSYKNIGTRPFYSELNFQDRLLATVEKTLYFDIPFFLPNITDNNLRLMKAVTTSLAQAKIPRLQVASLCADWGIGSDKLYQLIAVMEEVGLLKVIRFTQDRKAKTAGAKLFLQDPVLYSALKGNLGTAREALFALFCSASGWTIEACRDEKKGDFVISKTESFTQQNFTVEIGGPNKKRKASDFVIRDDLDYPSPKVLPLWLLGMGW